MPVDDSTPAADPTETPADPTPSEPEAKPAEDQNTAPAPSDNEANGGTDSTESGNNNASSDVSEDSKNNSQNNDVVSNSPENEISTQALQISLPEYGRKKAKYFVLLPKRGTPKNNKNQGQENYLPSSYDKATGTPGRDGGVWGLSADTGYEGFLTKAGKNRVRYLGNSVTDIANGVDKDYLNVPTNLGFFTEKNWDSNGNYTLQTNTDGAARNALLGEGFNGTGFEIVWYTIKHEVDGYHVDGYLKGVPVNVTYHSNFGDDATHVDTATTGDEYQALTTYSATNLPERQGYTFDGWYKDVNCTEVYEPTTLMGDLHLYAKWVKTSYNVEYYVDNQKIASESSVKVNTPVTVSSTTPAKEGYTFKCWTTDDVDVTVNDDGTSSFTMPERDVRFDAVFEINKYTVTWLNDDGKVVGTAEVDYNKTPNSNPTASKTDENFNYTFKGWKVSGDEGAEIVDPTKIPVTANVTYIAVFDATPRQKNYKYTIVKHFYDGNGAKVETPDSTETKTAVENTAIKGLYTKYEANQTVNGKTYVYVPALTTVNPAIETLTKDVTIDLYYYLDAKGDEKKPDENGNGIPDAWEYRLAFKVFNGEWNNGGNADVIYYVRATDDKGVKLNEVVVPVTRIPDVGDKPNSGYCAGSWDTFPGDNAKVEKNTVFTYTYAQQCTVTYKVDGVEYAKDTYKCDADVAIRTIPTKDGYTFSGWKIGTTDAVNFKMPAHDVTIEGTFVKNSSGGGHHHRRPTVTIPDDVPTGLNGDDHYAYIVGYPDKTVRPQNGITRAEVATIFFRLLTDETRNANSTKSNSYSDVAAGAWYNHAVSTLSAMGIVKGDSYGKFNPDAPITRAEFAAIAARFDDKANTTTADFSDIASHWAKNEISAASNNGWITGYPDGTFRPDNKITRAEAMTLVNRVLKRLPETEEDLHDDMIKWSDNSDVSQWFYLDVQEATNSHYYQTKENQFEKWTKLRETRDWTELEK
ncbi:MAG: S-layer homology domain-containing protein [Agathobaculum sp.]|nr:S-layer homology domain-containing protein [Agathobaculum sp.]